MQIIIVGCGRVGEALAEQLNGEGHDIVVVDQDPVKVRDVANKYDLMGIIGNGATHSVQTDAGVDTADLLIAVTGSDELNLLCCIMAKKAAGCRVIARVKSPEYAHDAAYLKDEIGLAMIINPELQAAKEIARVLNFPSAIKIETFSKGRVELLKFRLPENSPIASLTVKDAMVKLRTDVLICTVERGEEVHIPKGDFVFAERDIVSIIASPASAKQFFAKIGYNISGVKHAIIIGATSTAEYLCEEIKGSGIDLKIIDERRERCEELAEKYDDMAIICGDPTDEDILREEGIETTDALITLTGIDEENIMLSLFGKNMGVKKTVTKINRLEYTSVINSLELDSIIYPKHITADMILRYVRARSNTRGSSMETLYNIIKGKVEAVEFSIGERSPIAGKPLLELKFKDTALIAAILRGKNLIIPRGNVVINPGDSVIIVSTETGLEDASDILK